jgi:hypothetical protein
MYMRTKLWSAHVIVSRGRRCVALVGRFGTLEVDGMTMRWSGRWRDVCFGRWWRGEGRVVRGRVGKVGYGCV